MITVLIPTLNRSAFVIRYLRYLRDTGFRGRVCIGDSSTGEHLERTRQAVQELGARYEVVHREYPGLNNFECVRAMLPLVTTPFAMYICDDDLLVPATVEECMRFLDAHPDYSAATGAATMFEVRPDGAYGEIVSAREYRLSALEAATASERLLALLSDYTCVAYSVARAAQFKERWTACPSLADDMAVELLPGCLIAIQGKVKRFDRLFVARQNHGHRYLLADRFDWVTEPGWGESYEIFRQGVVEKLMREDRIDEPTASRVVKLAFWDYLMGALGSHRRSFNAPVTTGIRSRIRQLARRVPGVRGLWYHLRGRTDPLSLAALLRPGSRYHADFLPVLHAVTAPRATQPTR